MQDLLSKTKESLLLSALSSIAEKGYDNVTIDDIALATGNTKGAVYHYFSSKRQLYKEALHFLTNLLNSESTIPSEPKSSIKTVLGDMLLIAAGLKKHDRDRFTIQIQDIFYLYFDGIRRFPELARQLRKQRTEYLKLTIERIASSSEFKCSEKRLREFGFQFMVSIEGVSLMSALSDSFITVADIEGITNNLFSILDEAESVEPHTSERAPEPRP